MSNENYMPTLGMCFISAHLKSVGITAKCLDNYLEQLDEQSLLAEFLSEKIDLLVVYVPSNKMLFSFLEFYVRNHETLSGYISSICLAGPFAKANWKKILEKINVIDYILLEDVENSITTILNAKDKSEIHEIPNLAYIDRLSKKVVKTKRKIPKNLNKLKLPDMSYYFNKFGKELSYSILTCRGCQGHCSFCIINGLGNFKWQESSPEFIGDNIKLLGNQGISSFTFVDDNFFYSKNPQKKVEKLCSLIDKMEFKIKFSLSTRIVDILAYQSAFKSLRDRGLSCVFSGIESFFPQTQKIFRKEMSIDSIFKAIGILEDLNIDFRFGFIFFHPWTTFEEMQFNIHYLRKLYDNFSNIRACAPIQALEIIKSTPLFSRANRTGLLTGNPFKGYSFSIRDERSNAIYEKWKPINNLLSSRFSEYNSTIDFVKSQLDILKGIMNEY